MFHSLSKSSILYFISVATDFCIFYNYAYYWALCELTEAQYSPQCIIILHPLSNSSILDSVNTAFICIESVLYMYNTVNMGNTFTYAATHVLYTKYILIHGRPDVAILNVLTKSTIS